MGSKKPWWWPEPVTPEWRARIRTDYPEAANMDDDTLDNSYAEGWQYSDTWDHLGDARAEYQELADAFLALVAETGKSPSDFDTP